MKLARGAVAFENVNLADPDTFPDVGLDEYWRLRRAEQSPYLHPATASGPPFWVLSRYRDVLTLYQDHERFSSYAGNMLPSLHKPGGDPAAGKILALTDPPRHTAVRAMLLKSLTPRTRNYIVTQLQNRVNGLIAAAREQGTVDFAAVVAQRIPIATICDLVGFPTEDHALLLEWSMKALAADGDEDVGDDVWAARNDLLLYCAELAEERRAEPRDDLLSALVMGTVGGEPLSTEEVILNLYGLLLAGDQTARMAMTGAVHALAQHPQQWRALKSGDVPMAAAVEEILRWTTPLTHVGRTATTDVEMGGQLIAAGDLVTGWNSSANRDPESFAEPDVFDLVRTPNKHLSLGHGHHFCLGSYLGRAEVTAVLSALCPTVESIELCGIPTRTRSTVLQGFDSLSVRFG
jgi:cytochrome P450